DLVSLKLKLKPLIQSNRYLEIDDGIIGVPRQTNIPNLRSGILAQAQVAVDLLYPLFNRRLRKLIALFERQRLSHAIVLFRTSALHVDFADAHGFVRHHRDIYLGLLSADLTARHLNLGIGKAMFVIGDLKPLL